MQNKSTKAANLQVRTSAQAEKTGGVVADVVQGCCRCGAGFLPAAAAVYGCEESPRYLGLFGWLFGGMWRLRALSLPPLFLPVLLLFVLLFFLVLLVLSLLLVLHPQLTALSLLCLPFLFLFPFFICLVLFMNIIERKYKWNA